MDQLQIRGNVWVSDVIISETSFISGIAVDAPAL
jgi:hypothetical protein